ncbi:hypothetical protein B0A48_14392 [Cryoendolithus antarcticus]|uniref:MADS-box domain-containing protein n=1 Tax=Cryoendolithus antarcticus TaxID=1507870 RepID=A0A1V8SJU4_9PEZI|nr:hypothetical protein B0A48_14392 [Cryoendolithus antarcticus]
MGRRKIEIKPIKDDRNRSVTFLKRKGGLFKKAHELSVLCSVDVAVIIFGHNKKLHEYSSGDINELVGRFQYYAGAHEHKGPADFVDKRGGGDDDDDDDDIDGQDGGEERGTPDQHPMMQTPGMHSHPAFQQVRQGTPGGSPPIGNGSMPQFQRVPSPLPPGGSRPSSRTSQHPVQPPQHLRRTSSNLVPPGHPQHTQGPPQPVSYAYTPNPPFYNPQAAAQAQMQQRPQVLATYPPPYPPHHPQHPQHPSMTQVVMQENRRQSGPPAFPQQQQQPAPPPQAQMQRNVSNDRLQPPPHHGAHPSPQMQQQQRPMPSSQPSQQQFTSPPLPQPKPLPARAQHSIFTPIDDSRSLLAQHWGTSGAPEQSAIKIEGGGPRSASIDVAAMQRDRPNGTSPRPQQPMRSPRPPQRTGSTPIINPPTRSNTSQSEAKRPRLTVQIPSEASGDEGNTADASDASTSHPSHPPNPQQHHVVLPPPSPSANALLSAGAQGPPNPFARPAPPMSTNPHARDRDANHIETPMSALPSRFMNDNLLPSPSSFYPEWGFGRSGGGGGDMLPSPLNFQTPVVAGQGWGSGVSSGNGNGGARSEEGKRGADDEGDGGGGKRARP